MYVAGRRRRGIPHKVINSIDLLKSLVFLGGTYFHIGAMDKIIVPHLLKVSGGITQS